jgi:hypothetical protein
VAVLDDIGADKLRGQFSSPSLGEVQVFSGQINFRPNVIGDLLRTLLVGMVGRPNSGFDDGVMSQGDIRKCAVDESFTLGSADASSGTCVNWGTYP